VIAFAAMTPSRLPPAILLVDPAAAGKAAAGKIGARVAHLLRA
jgi:hypothetical protein